jgi:hypothetical protein
MMPVHHATSHASEKDESKFLKLQQIAIRAGVRLVPKQSAKHLRRNMMYSSPPKRIGPDLARSVQRRVRLSRAELTTEKLEMDGVAMDYSYASLTAFVDLKWFATLLARHNDPGSEFHLDVFEPNVIGKDLNPSGPAAARFPCTSPPPPLPRPKQSRRAGRSCAAYQRPVLRLAPRAA